MKSIDEAVSYVHPKHPRRNGVWPQYIGLQTRLRGRFYYSDIIHPGDEWETYDGKTAEVVNLEEQTPENYHGTHNHYQTLLSEVWNFTPHTNAVPMWGDGCALAHEAGAWGAFFSARSFYVDPEHNENSHAAKARPEGFTLPPRDEFDCQLIGLEVDVLNGGKPGVFPNKAKHGVQIVGFGNPNSHAVSVICENFDCPPEMHKGQFEAGLYFQNAVHPDYGRLMVADFEKAHIGLDFRKSVFSWGAAQLSAPRPGTGIVFGEGRDGEVYSGPRHEGAPEDKSWMTVRMGSEGFRVMNADGTKEMLAIDAYGGIYLNGDLYINGALHEGESREPAKEPTVFDRVAKWLNRVFFGG
jgi:hypothetical protein